jgi:hypothetical protein
MKYLPNEKRQKKESTLEIVKFWNTKIGWGKKDKDNQKKKKV